MTEVPLEYSMYGICFKVTEFSKRTVPEHYIKNSTKVILT